MLRRQRSITLGILLTATIMMGVFLPGRLNKIDLQDPFFNTPQPTSTRFKVPINDIIDVVYSNLNEPPVEVSESNCTYPVIYWKNYPDSWPAEIIIAGKPYPKDEVRRLYTDLEPDLQVRLITHLYTSFLNILHGADMVVIENIIVEASGWLTTYPTGSELSEFNRERGLYLIQILENYNNGQIGPGPCKDSPGTATFTPTITLTFTPAPPTETTTPSVTQAQQPGESQSTQPAQPPDRQEPVTPQMSPTSVPTPIFTPTFTALPPSPTSPVQTPTVSPTSRIGAPTRTPSPTATRLPSSPTPPPTAAVLPPSPTPSPTATSLPPSPTSTTPPTATSPIPLPTYTPTISTPTATPLVSTPSPTTEPLPTGTPTPPDPTDPPPTDAPNPGQTRRP